MSFNFKLDSSLCLKNILHHIFLVDHLFASWEATGTGKTYALHRNVGAEKSVTGCKIILIQDYQPPLPPLPKLRHGSLRGV